MMKLLDKIFDEFLNWLENVQWSRDDRRYRRKRKKETKRNLALKKKIDKAKSLLKDNGYTLEREWTDITYRGERYTPTMVEEIISDEGDLIIIHARKVR